jgi:hypothetical protein
MFGTDNGLQPIVQGKNLMDVPQLLAAESVE